MLRQQRVRTALFSLAVAALLLTIGTVPKANAIEAPTSAPDGASHGVAAPPCNPATPFKATNFPSTPADNNTWYPLVPGTQFILQGHVNAGNTPLPHQVIFTVTDLTKVVHGVRTAVIWDRDFNEGVLTEAELAFHAEDYDGNVWNLGEYPEQYSGGKFTGAPDTWVSGLAQGQGGILLPGNPQLGTPLFLQAYAPDIIGDCGQVSAVNAHVCDLRNVCYDNVLVVDESSPPEPGIQQKYYAPGVGNFQIGAVDDPQAEVMVLVEVKHLNAAECAVARQEALKLEQHAYQISPKLYGLTSPAEHTAQCATPPTETPVTTTPVTATPPTETPATPTLPTATPQPAPNLSIYMPLVSSILATPSPTPTTLPTPSVPPAVYDGCRSTPNPAGAANTPVRIVKVDKVREIVTLQNVSDRTISLEDWNMCSLGTHQDHDQIFGTIAPGQTRDFPNTGDGPVWNDNTRNDGALYNAAGFLVSYWVDQ